ncbi:MAG: hypothetical protein FJ109_06035 [Deltaproteobacteria bacterium]|nr:hypothetical protein [Deltaproteobacteria bacterium]
MKKLCLFVVLLAACSGTGRKEVEDGQPSDSQVDHASLTDVSDKVEPDLQRSDLVEVDGPRLPQDTTVDAPPDLPPDLSLDVLPDMQPDTPPDVQPDLPPLPDGCCYTDADCPPGETGEAAVCAGQALGWPNGAGVCKSKPSDPGRCYGDQHCPKGKQCDGESVCGCNSDCDMDYEGPGICVPDDGSCPTIDPDWVLEYCNAASIVIFDGQKCVSTCPGCCECKPFCKYTFQTIEECEASCVTATPQCPLYVAALQTEPFALVEPEGGCVLATQSSACAADEDCPLVPLDLFGEIGDTCVMGNCVFCWNDSQCKAGELCRAGRCVPDWTGGCPEPPLCKLEDGCRLIKPSEKPCPICVCDSTYSIECYTDEFCMIFSFHPFSRCVYGRCADCRNDADCPAPWSTGTKCIPPGICYDMTPPPSELYGTWLIGWYGGLDHFSYFRFEQDGTLRRGHYEMQDTFMDDFPGFPCYPGEDVTYPLLGTWEPEITQSGFLVIRVNLNTSCDPKAGFTARWMFSPSQDGQSADVKDVDTGYTWLAIRYPTDTCLPDMSLCEAPQYPL